MSYFITIIIILIVIILVLVGRKRVVVYMDKRQGKREERKNRILEMLKQKDKITKR